MDRFAGLSLEHVPAGTCVPAWLMSALMDGKRILVIHASEHSRSDGLEKYPDSSLHLTFERFIEQLHLDLGLARVMEEDGVRAELLHQRTARLAKRGELPLLHSDENTRWSRRRTERLLLLDKTLSELRSLPKWEEDPGISTFRQERKKLAEELDRIHPFDLESIIFKELSSREEPPFSLLTIDGIVVLDHPPSFTPIRISWLEQILRFKPIHQLCAPGSHRLGEHGALIADIPVSGRPGWLPKTETSLPQIAQTHRILLENRSDNIAATHSLLYNYPRDETVLIIDASSSHDKWRRIFNNLGQEFPTPAISCMETKLISLISRISRLPLGEDSWSLESLILLNNLRSMPFENGPTSGLLHPQNDEWQPRMHRHVLQRIARGFHLLGGRGSLRRWSNTLAIAKPTLGRDSDSEKQALEETQWWLCCMVAWLNPLIPLEERLDEVKNAGCSTGSPLPIKPSSSSPDEWLKDLYANIDWKKLIDTDPDSVRAAQHLVAAHNELRNHHKSPDSLADWCDELDELGFQTKLSGKSKSSNWQVLSPDQAHGVKASLVILADVTSTSWNLVPKETPWIDAQTRIDIGLDPPEIGQMRGRHLLHSWLNSASRVILLDPCLDDEGILASPIEQWLQMCKEDNSLSELCEPPPQISPDDWHPETRHRSWKMVSQERQVWLCYSPTSMSITENLMVHNRAGMLPLDIRQRSGIKLFEGHAPEGRSISTTNLLTAFEGSMNADLKRRSPKPKDLLEGETLHWSERSYLHNIDDLNLSTRTKVKGITVRQSSNWPHLAQRIDGHLLPGIDPRPLPVPTLCNPTLDLRMGRLSNDNIQNQNWSPSRLETWLSCPRRGWLELGLRAGEGEVQGEDLDLRTRGDIVHLAEMAILSANGITPDGKQPSNPKPLPSGGEHDSWKAVLEEISVVANWLDRADAVAGHRRMDLISCDSLEWREWLTESILPAISGRLGGMVIADHSLVDCAPIASEWRIPYNSRRIEIGDLSLNIRGRLDRADKIIIDLPETTDEIQPLDMDLSDPIRANRLVIIRDLKSIEGPNSSAAGKRHERALTEELQLALYARAWEIANPGDRVVGAGITEVGEWTTHFVELDPEFLQLTEGMELGKITQHCSFLYRREDDDELRSNPFRAWMRNRLQTALEVAQIAGQGRREPRPSKSCNWCPVKQACPSAQEVRH